MVRKDAKGEIKWEELWATQIYRSQSGGKDWIGAHVRRKYGESDVETKGPGEYIGYAQDIIYEMETDNDPDSPTFQKRIPKEITVYDQTGKELKQKVQAGIDNRPIHEATKKMLENYRRLVGHMPKPHGDTQLYWLFKEQKIQANDVNEFFDVPLKTVHEKLIKRKTLIDKPLPEEEAVV